VTTQVFGYFVFVRHSVHALRERHNRLKIFLAQQPIASGAVPVTAYAEMGDIALVPRRGGQIR
jgi:hypothetical protein